MEDLKDIAYTSERYINVVVLSTALAVSYFGVGLLFLFVDLTGHPHWILKYKTQPQGQTITAADVKKVFRTLTINTFLIHIPFMFVYYDLQKWRQCDLTFTLPDVTVFIRDMVVCIIVEEISFFYSHRILHSPFLYKYVHKQHHEFQAPFGLVAAYGHPVEFGFSNIGTVMLGPLVAGSCVMSSAAWFVLSVSVTIIHHSGYHLPFLPSPEFHDYHHLKFVGNYGVLGILDWIHGTDEQFRRSKQYKRHKVCLDKLNDLQLAMVICRLYEGEDMMPESVKDILYTHILGCDTQGNKCDNYRAHPDPFLRSMALWLLKDYRASLNTLLHSSVGITHKTAVDTNDLEGHNAMPSVFNFYNYLRTHPLLVRQRIAATGQSSKKKNIISGFTRQQTVVLDDSSVFVDKVTPMERRLFFSTAHSHYMNGCPLLALEVLSKLPPVIEDKNNTSDSQETKTTEYSGVKDDCINTGTLEDFDSSKTQSNTSKSVDWSQPLVNGYDNSSSGLDWSSPVSSHAKQSADSLDWGAPVSKFDNEEPSFKLSSDEDDSEEEDKFECDIFNSAKPKGKLTKIPTIVIDEASKEVSSAEESPRDKTVPPVSKSQQQLDIFAQQIKFTACLKVLMEEMQTLATGFEVDGGQLRFQLYIWLEREVEVLNFLCNYGGNQDDEENDVLSIQDEIYRSVLGNIIWSTTLKTMP